MHFHFIHSFISVISSIFFLLCRASFSRLSTSDAKWRLHVWRFLRLSYPNCSIVFSSLFNYDCFLIPCLHVVGKAKSSSAQNHLLSGITSVVDRIRRDAYDGDFDPVLERHSLDALEVTGRVQQPAFLCQSGSVLQRQTCGICHCCNHPVILADRQQTVASHHTVRKYST